MQVVYPLAQASFPATVVRGTTTNLRVKYEDLSLEEEELLTLVALFSRLFMAEPERAPEKDQPLRSFARLVRLSVKGVVYALLSLVPKRK